MPRDLDWAIKKSLWDLHLHVSILYSFAAIRYDSELLSSVLTPIRILRINNFLSESFFVEEFSLTVAATENFRE